MNRDFKTRTAIFLAVVREDEILLSLRKNTGWLDGYYDMPSGHLEPGETLTQAGIRELHEESGLIAEERDLELYHICQNYMTPDKPYIFFFFKVNKWTGEPRIREPNLSEKQAFYHPDNLPEKTLPYVAAAISELASKAVSFSYFGPDSKPE